MQSKHTRTIGIVLAVILGMAALFYLGGLVTQLQLSYQQWLADGGFTGDAMMAPVDYGILGCWRAALSPTGLKNTVLRQHWPPSCISSCGSITDLETATMIPATSPAASGAPMAQQAG